MYFSSMFEHFVTQAHCISYVNKLHFQSVFLVPLEESHLAFTSAYRSDFHPASHNFSTSSEIQRNFVRKTLIKTPHRKHRCSLVFFLKWTALKKWNCLLSIAVLCRHIFLLTNLLFIYLREAAYWLMYLWKVTKQEKKCIRIYACRNHNIYTHESRWGHPCSSLSFFVCCVLCT